MNHRSLLPLCLAVVLAQGGCGGLEQPLADDFGADGEPVPGANGGSGEEALAAEKEPAPWEVVPVSDAPHGEFPYFTVPRGYHTNGKLSSTVSLGRFPFWTGERYVEVEGRIHQANLRADEGRIFSSIEVAQNVDQVISSIGGVKISDMVIPRGRSAEVLTRSFTQEFRNGLCWPSEPVRTYVVRRSDKDIWIHACTYGGIGAAWVIVEAENSLPDPEPLDAGGLASRLRTDGRATVPFAFQSAAADILENEAPRIDAIAEVLDQEADWRFAVSGYAGAGVGPAQAAQLADARAQAVVSALVAAGIDPDRLSVVPSADTEPSRESGRNIELTLLPAESGASAPASLP